MVLLIIALFMIAAPQLRAASDDVSTVKPSSPAIAANNDGTGLFNQTNYLIAAGLGSVCLVNQSLGNCDAIARSLENSPFDDYFDIGNGYGRGDLMGLVALGFYGVGRTTGHERMTDTGRDLTQALLATWTVTWALKLSIDSPRPNGHSYSFPSGHTATAFAAAPVFYRHYGAFAGYSAYILATFTGLARVEDRMHHPTDVFAGAAIGIISGRTFASSTPLGLIPSPGGAKIGVTRKF